MDERTLDMLLQFSPIHPKNKKLVTMAYRAYIISVLVLGISAYHSHAKRMVRLLDGVQISREKGHISRDLYVDIVQHVADQRSNWSAACVRIFPPTVCASASRPFAKLP